MGPTMMTQTTCEKASTLLTHSGDPSWVVAADGGPRGAPAELQLLGVAPDAAGRHLLITVRLHWRSTLRVDVYDMAGALVRSLVSGRQANQHWARGDHVVAWDGRDARGHGVAPGLYQVLARGEREEAAWSLEWVGPTDHGAARPDAGGPVAGVVARRP